MKRNLLFLITLHFSLLTFNSQSAEPIELVVYSNEAGDGPLHIETIETNLYSRTRSWTFPASYVGHRSVCRLPDATTNDSFLAWSGGDRFEPGNLFGVSSLRDYPAIELKRLDHVFARVNLYTGSDDRVLKFGSQSGDVDWTFATNKAHWVDDAVYGFATNEYEHVRIVPFLVAGIMIDTPPGSLEYSCTYSLVTNRVVAEFDINRTTKPCITEADFLRDGKFDIDWDGFDNGIALSPVGNAVGDVTAVKYRIVFGKSGPVGRESSTADETTKVRAFSTLIERRYEPWDKRTKPTQLKTDGVVHGAQPTFKWRLDENTEILGYSPSSALFGCSYTAFQIEVYNRDTNEKVYDSGLVRAPAKDANGFFTWTAPLYAGDQTDLKAIFAKAGNWKWRVVMNNAKFLPKYNDDEDAPGWSAYAEFSTSVNAQQD